MSQSAIGPAIRAIRKEKGISQNQLAKGRDLAVWFKFH